MTDSSYRMWRSKGMRHVRLGVALSLLALLLAVGSVNGAGVASAANALTFAKDVAPILQAKCQECHRAGSIAPMSLVTYEETRPWARAIRERVSTRQMPPWHIDRHLGVQKFKNDLSLSDEQIDTIVRWVDSGAPMGNPADLPPPSQWPSDNEWRAAKLLGQPDLVISSAPYTMPARQQDVWFRPVSEIPITDPRWVRAVEIRPSTLQGRKIVHHAVAYLEQDDKDPLAFPPGSGNAAAERRGMFTEWAIGKAYELYRPNTGKLLLPGARIWWDKHMHAVGEEITASVELGIWFYPKGQDPKYRAYLTSFSAMKNGRWSIDIPPNSVVENEGFTVLKQAARLESFQPHMHMRGKAMELEAILPDGRTQIVSRVSNFNFNWMINYIFDDDAATVYPKGTIIHTTAWYDNTKANKNNPDPDQWVGFGERSVDEMGHAWVTVTYLSDEDYAEWVAKHPPARASQN